MPQKHLKLCTFLAFAITYGCVHAPVSPADYMKKQMEDLATKYKTEQTFTIRLNRAPCECPPFEILLDDVWHRVFLEPGGTIKDIENFEAELEAQENAGMDAHKVVTGNLASGIRTAPNNSVCLVLKLLDAGQGPKPLTGEE